MNTENNDNTTAKTAGLITRLLTGWGIPGSIARIIAAALAAAIITAATMAETGCTAAYSQRVTAEGITETTYSGELNPLPLDVLKEENK